MKTIFYLALLGGIGWGIWTAVTYLSERGDTTGTFKTEKTQVVDQAKDKAVKKALGIQ